MKKKHVILAGVILIIGLISFLSSPVFYISYIEFKGVNILSEDDVISGDFRKKIEGKNIWTINTREMEEKIINNRYIEEVTFKRNFPSELEIIVEERMPVGKILNNDKYLLFDGKGYILEENTKNPKFDVPLIQGAGYIFENEYLQFSSELERIVRALEVMGFTNRNAIDRIYFENTEINCILLNDIDVYFGQKNRLERKFEIFDSTIEKIKSEKMKVDYIDLQLVNRPVLKKNE